MKEENKKKCAAIQKVWGWDRQAMMLCEEFAELQKEVLKNVNRDHDNIKEITEEVADVSVMLEQLKQHYGISEENIEEVISYKLDRHINKYGIEVK